MLDRRRRRQGFALVVVLVILSLLTVIAVGYLSSMSSERATANAFSNKTRAEEMAQAGVDSAVGTLRDYFKAFPDSATAWDKTQSTNADGTTNEGTTLYLRAVPGSNGGDSPDPAPGLGDPNYARADFNGGNGPNNGAANGADARRTFVLPLVSGATVRQLTNKAKTLPTPATADFVNLNGRRQIGDTQGWLGTPPSSIYSNPSALPKPVLVPWMEVKQRDGFTDPTQAPVVGRYAFWVEDESFRANVNYTGLGNSTDNLRRDNPKDGTPALNPTDVNLLGLLDLISPALGITPDPNIAVGQNIFGARNEYPGLIFPESRAFAHTGGLSADVINQLHYFTTSQSAALNLSRHGTQRLNLNAVVPQTTTAADRITAQTQIDKLVKTLQFHAPNFGQRFYRTNWTGTPPVPTDLNNAQTVSSTTAAPHALIYLYKVAANLLDYIDPDVVPTVIDAGGQVHPVTRPTQPLNFDGLGPNPAWAIGKDAAPVMQESAMRYAGTVSTGTTGRYTVYLDYYVEMWNMSDKTITGQDLGPHPFVRVTDQPPWQADNKNSPTIPAVPVTDDSGISLSNPNPQTRDFDIDISGVTFPPGVATVITTDPDWKSITVPTDPSVISIADVNLANQMEAAKHFVVCPIISPGGKRIYSGPMPAGCNELKMLPRESPSDYETEITIGNDNGYIDSLAGALPIVGGTISIPRASSARVVNGGYLRGNAVQSYAADGSTGGGLQPSEVGDPRTNNEQLAFTVHIPSGDATDQTGYKEFFKNPGDTQILPTFGLPNLNSVAPAKPKNPWPDYYWYPGSKVSPGVGQPAVMNAANAPAIFANAALVSIGQLGDIFDPARLPAYSGGDVTGSRGGGRTFRIGQHDDLYDGTPNSSSSTWASWRLADIFSVTDAIEQPGLININGLARDNGAALRAAFQGFKFQPTTKDYTDSQYDPSVHGDVQLNGKTFDASGLQNLITDIINNRLKNTDPTKPGPFFERGELSETPILNPATMGSTMLVTGVDTKTVFDRGREELVRRLIEMTTTRGSVFTVYALGQSINQTTASGTIKKNVTGTHQLRVTFKLTPKTSMGQPFHPATDSSGNPADFNPNDPAQVNNRFLKPDHYDIEVLSSSSGSS